MIDNFDLEKLERLHRQIHKKFISEWNAISPEKLSLPQANMLQMLHKEGTIKVSDLADMLCITPGGLTLQCDKLEERVLIHRDRDEEDRRIVYLKLSEEGEKVVLQITKLKNSLLTRMIKGVPVEELLLLKKLYVDVLRNLGEDSCAET